MAYGPGDRPGKVTRRKPAPPSFPTFVPDRPGQTPGEKTSERKRAKRVTLSAQRKRTGGDRPILVKRRQAKAKETAPAEAYASLGAAVEHAATQQRRGLALGAPEHEAAAARVLHAALHGAGEAAHVAGQGITGAAGAAGEATRQAVTGDFWLKHIGLDRPHEGAAESVVKLAGNIAPDIGELAVTTPSSIGKLAATAATDPKHLPGMLAQPYKEFAKDPIKFATDKPVSTALMFAPVVRVPGRVAGRVARVAGKQTLERTPATVAGTPLRVARSGPRGLISGAVSARRERGREAPQLTGTKAEDEINRRVDDFFGSTEQPHLRRVAKRAEQQSAERGHTPNKAANHMKGALAGARREINKRFEEEFGDSDIASARLAKHRSVGSSPATPARVLRVSRRLFTGSVLPYSTKWATGQATEAALRSLVTGAGPLSYLRARKLLRDHPQVAEELFSRAVPGGFGAETLAKGGAPVKTIAEEFQGAGGRVERTAKKLTEVGKTPGLPALRAANHRWRSFVFETAAGKIERGTQTAMLGKALKDSPLMDKHVLGLSDKAIAEAAQGLKATENQVALARQVRKMYGAYSHFSPEMRGAIMHWVPFLPWFINTTRFLLQTLPRDHPMWAAAAADLDAATQEWREANRLSERGEDHMPGYLMGSYPVGEEGQVSRIGHYLPFAPGEIIDDPGGGVLDLLLPQFGSAADVARGRNPFGEPRYDKPSTAERAGGTALELSKAFVPGLGAALGTAKDPRRQWIPGYPTRPTGKVKRKGGLTLKASAPLRYRDEPLR